VSIVFFFALVLIFTYYITLIIFCTVYFTTSIVQYFGNILNGMAIMPIKLCWLEMKMHISFLKKNNNNNMFTP